MHLKQIRTSSEQKQYVGVYTFKFPRMSETDNRFMNHGGEIAIYCYFANYKDFNAELPFFRQKNGNSGLFLPTL